MKVVQYHCYAAYLAGVVLLTTILPAAGCRRAGSTASTTTPSSATPPTVSVGVVRTQQLENVVRLPATVESDELAMLMPRVEAYVREVLVDIGDEVAADQVLVQLDAPELQQKFQQQSAMVEQLRAGERVMQAELQAAGAQLDDVRAQLRLKRSERDRLSRLADSGAISRQRLEEADSAAQSAQATLARYESTVQVAEARLEKGAAELAVAQAMYEQAETLAGYLQIKAPFAGVVAKRNVDPGNLVLPANQGQDASPLLTLAKVDKLRAVVHVTTDIAGGLTVGAPAVFATDDMPGREFPSQISRRSGTYDDQTRMLRAEIDLENPRDPATGERPLRAGSYGTATIVLQSATLPVVPQSALRQSAGRASVVVVYNNTCLVRPIEVALESDGLVGVASGISAGDQVVIEKPDDLRDEQQLQQSQIKMVAW